MSELGDSVSMESLAEDLKALRREQRVVVVPKERVVSKFTGDAKQVTIIEFREQVEAAWAAQATEREEDKLQFLLSHLSTSVREEIFCHPPAARSTAKEVLGILERVYGDKRSVCQLLTVFNATHQRQGETVRAYSSRLNRAFNDLTTKQRQDGQQALSDKILRDQFIAQLSDGLLLRQLRESAYRNPTLTFFDVREEAIRWQADDEERSSAIPAHTAAATAASPGVVDTLVEELKNLRAELAAMKDQMTQQHHHKAMGHPTSTKQKYEYTKEGKPICFRCKKSGHIGRKCPAHSGNDGPPQ